MTIHFVGAGPGAADLLTVRATRLLASADVVLYPGTYLDPEVLSHAGVGAILIDTQDLSLDEIVAHVLEAHRAGRQVVRLASGDLSLYSALAEQTARLDSAGVDWDVTPGVPAYAAAAASLGRELTVPRLAQSVVLTRVQARSSVMPDAEALAAFAATRATLVLHLAITRIADVMAELEPFYGPHCPAAVVYRASQPAEQVLRGTVATIAAAAQAAGFRQAAVILVGVALDPSVVGTQGGPGSTTANESYLYSADRDRADKDRADKDRADKDRAGKLSWSTSTE